MSEVKHVLIVEDDLMFMVRLESVLKRLGYTPLTARTAEKALEIAQTHPLCLSILSFGRTHLQPKEIATQLKALPNAAPILGFLSHVLIPEQRTAIKAAGCDLLVPNSSIVLRLPPLMERLAPFDGSQADLTSAQEIADAEEES